MATIKSFEDIDSWKKARELYKLIGQLMDEGKFKMASGSLIKLRVRQALLWIILRSVLKGGQELNLYSFLDISKALVVKLDHNYTGLLT